MRLRSRNLINKRLIFVLLIGVLVGSAALTHQWKNTSTQSSAPSQASVKVPVAGEAPLLTKPISIKPVVIRKSEPVKVVPIDLASKGNRADKRSSP
jgi:hypothetical protein